MLKLARNTEYSKAIMIHPLGTMNVSPIHPIVNDILQSGATWWTAQQTSIKPSSHNHGYKECYSKMRLICLLSGATISIVNVMSWGIVSNRPHFPQPLTLLRKINLLQVIYPLKCLSFHHPDLPESFILVCTRIKYSMYILTCTAGNKSQTGKDVFFFFFPPSLLATLHYREELRGSKEGSTVHLVWINVFRHPVPLKLQLTDCSAALYLCKFSQLPLTKPPLMTCRWKKKSALSSFFML